MFIKIKLIPLLKKITRIFLADVTPTKNIRVQEIPM